MLPVKQTSAFSPSAGHRPDRKLPLLLPFIASFARICYFQQSGLRLIDPVTSVTAALNKNRYIRSGVKTTEHCLVTIKQLITVTTWIITITMLLTQSNLLPGTLHSIVERKLPVVTFFHQVSHLKWTVHIYTLFAAVLRPHSTYKILSKHKYKSQLLSTVTTVSDSD